MEKVITVVGTATETIDIKKGTRFYDNGACVQVLKGSIWYRISKQDWSAIQVHFALHEEKEAPPFERHTNYTIISDFDK
jgi:hypothetical protein